MGDDLHFVIFPLMAQGHMIPMVDIARILAHRGATVTIVTTPVTAARFRPSLSRAIEAKHKIQLLELPLPLAEVGLPEGFEDFDRIPSPEDAIKIFTAMDLYEKPAEDLLRRLSPPAACIISDSIFNWTTNTARWLNIPRLVFYGPGCFWLLCQHIAVQTDILDRIESGSDRFFLPGLPDRVELTKLKVFGSKTISVNEKLVRHRSREAEKAAYGIMVNSFEELEPEYVNELAKAKSKKIWCIGPVSLCNKDSKDIAERGNKGAINEHDCLKWLDAREPGSVVYVGLGSLTLMSTEQAIEVALGLEYMNQPFIWCIRTETEELKKWFSEQGFEERVSDRGLIVHGWAPQVLILSHRSVGGFVTHCGWNSILESISAGVPMITWPHFADQFLNETFVVEIVKIGIRVSDHEEEIGVMVKKDEIKIAVRCLMDDGDEGKLRRKRVGELAEMAKKAMEEGGSSYLNVSSLIRDVRGWDRENGKLEVVPVAV